MNETSVYLCSFHLNQKPRMSLFLGNPRGNSKNPFGAIIQWNLNVFFQFCGSVPGNSWSVSAAEAIYCRCGCSCSKARQSAVELEPVFCYVHRVLCSHSMFAVVVFVEATDLRPPAFSSVLTWCQQKRSFLKFICVLLFEGTFTISFQEIKSQKEVTKQ